MYIQSCCARNSWLVIFPWLLPLNERQSSRAILYTLSHGRNSRVTRYTRAICLPFKPAARSRRKRAGALLFLASSVINAETAICYCPFPSTPSHPLGNRTRYLNVSGVQMHLHGRRSATRLSRGDKRLIGRVESLSLDSPLAKNGSFLASYRKVLYIIAVVSAIVLMAMG